MQRFECSTRYARRFSGLIASRTSLEKVTRKGARDNGKSCQPITRDPEVVRPTYRSRH